MSVCFPRFIDLEVEEYCIVDYFGQWMFVHGPSGLFLPIEKTFLDFVC